MVVWPVGMVCEVLLDFNENSFSELKVLHGIMVPGHGERSRLYVVTFYVRRYRKFANCGC